MKWSGFLRAHSPWRALAVILFAALAFATLTSAQSDEIVPNENLVVEGIPKLPASLAESVGRYSEFRAAAFVSWHQPNAKCSSKPALAIPFRYTR
jgi:hypothetical protein